MECTIGETNRQRQWGAIACMIAVSGLVVLAVTGIVVESVWGLVACPAQLVGKEEKQRERFERRCKHREFAWRAGWWWLRQSWVVVAVRSEAMMALVVVTECEEWGWVCVLPWVVWLWKGVGVAWPGLGRREVYHRWVWVWEQAERTALIGLTLTWVGQQALAMRGSGAWGLTAGMSLQSQATEASVVVEQDGEGIYHVRLSGEFELYVDGNIGFYKRMLIIFLGLLDVPGETRRSRRTRDGRTPFCRQEQMAEWFEVTHPEISRWNDYWLRQDWRRMLSQRRGEVLTLDLQQQIVDSWVKFPWLGADRARKHLWNHGIRVTRNQVRQVARESGWSALRQALVRVYAVDVESFRPRDEWLTRQLLAQVQQLVEQLETLGALTQEQRIEIGDLKAMCGDLELRPAMPHRPLPWMLRLEHQLFGRWEWIDDGTVRCIYCGTTNVSRKSRKPRLKRYVDEHGVPQAVEVYRFYCHNPACEYKSFTNLPPNLIPHSKRTLDHHLAALQQYECSHSIYRCTSQMLGVSKTTAYRWVSAFGYQLLPVVAIFGVVRSSGVVGIDEKYVLVPKNDKPNSKMKRWMYVYVAVDCYTYDLLHIEIYPYNNKHSANAFLLALRTKGYHPRVVVTDMRVDYNDVIAQVFPKAVHHECIFHALKELGKCIREIYGSKHSETHPEVKILKQEIDHIFDARTKRTARRRYLKVLAQREQFVTQTPDAACLFDFLERHWPKLVNAIESQHIPTTNNATEQVIRIFNQHYKTFCGFESIESARIYLAVFEKVYRFTPFSNDAQPHIRGKCPLELAGYEVLNLPMAQLFRGFAFQWPASAFQGLVPNV